MRFDKDNFNQIWHAALPLQDKRDDKGHAEIVTSYAVELLKNVQADADIVIPAAILHDIGWGKLPRDARYHPFSPHRTVESERTVRKMHEEEGARLARELLSALGYPTDKTERIAEIIAGHDTREGFISPEDGLVRDADKLWRFSKLGFIKDLERFGTPFGKLFPKRNAQVDQEGFFYSEAAKNIARAELQKRKAEYDILM